ncbi:MAG: sugar phosphate isomerase/epimerase [Kiritimatiellae bacterium]|nr:sugar phosphate isomerase/epimerase [Kiritimatiellia bacterium]
MLTRRNFLEAMAATGAAAALPGCCNKCCGGVKGVIALQLYSIHQYIGKQGQGKLGLEKALAEVRKIGYKSVEFAGYYGADAAELKKMLADNGLTVCGTHVSNAAYGFDMKNFTFDKDVLKKTCDFELAYGNSHVICPGGGNFPPGCSWSTGQGGEPCKSSKEIDDFTKKLCDLYNQAADVAKGYGCTIGLHNHTWEHAIFLTDGTSFWDYFFSNTRDNVCMEQDVGWTTCAGDTIKGVNPMVQYTKYPHRSPTLHAKENGMGKGVKKFDAILGKPGCDENGKPCATPVDWDALLPVAEKDGVKYWVVECERHFDSLEAVTPSYQFLKTKGLN